jgi:hypothetical protein
MASSACNARDVMVPHVVAIDRSLTLSALIRVSDTRIGAGSRADS